MSTEIGEPLSSSSKRKITVMTFDGMQLDIGEDIAVESERLKKYFMDNRDASKKNLVFCMPEGVAMDAVVEVFEFCRKNAQLQSKKVAAGEVKAIDFGFATEVKCDRRDFVEAAYYLGIKHPHDMFVELVFDSFEDRE